MSNEETRWKKRENMKKGKNKKNIWENRRKEGDTVRKKQRKKINVKYKVGRKINDWVKYIPLWPFIVQKNTVENYSQRIKYVPSWIYS